MNKYLYIVIALVALLGAGLAYQKLGPQNNSVSATGETKEFTVRAVKNEWRFEPEIIEVNQGDLVKLTVINEDEYDHGIAIDSFGISQKMPAGKTIKIEFVATKAGEYTMYCSVPCGEGEVDGEKRGHLDQVGKFKVRGVVKRLPAEDVGVSMSQ